jgi:hypothetical protein
MDKASVSWFALGRFDLQGLRTEAQQFLFDRIRNSRKEVDCVQGAVFLMKTAL